MLWVRLEVAVTRRGSGFQPGGSGGLQAARSRTHQPHGAGAPVNRQAKCLTHLTATSNHSNSVDALLAVLIYSPQYPTAMRRALLPSGGHMSMSARYRIKEHNQRFTPQRRMLGLWWRIAASQKTMQAASEIIRQKLRMAQPPEAAP